MSPPRDHAMQCRPMKHARVERGLNERHCLLSTVVVDANDPLTLLANDSFISVVSDSVEIADQSSEPRRQSGAKNGPVILQSTQRIDFACAEASNEDGKSIALDSSRVVVKSEEHTIVDDVNITQELTGSSPPEKNWRGIVIAILVIIMVLSMIVVAIIVITPKSGDINTGEPFTFEDVTSGNYRPQSFGVKWIGEKDMYVYQSKHNELMEYDCARNTTTLVMGNVTFRQLSTNSYLVSEDLEYVLLKHDVEMVYRYSSYAKYSIYHRYAKDPESKLIPFPQGVGKGWKEKKLQYVSWSPKGHSLVFIYDNNLYYQKDPFTTATKISASGVPGRVYNGIADWLYEEEIFSSTAAHWWSADGAYLCYAHFDDSNVPTYKFPIYGPGSQIYDNIKQVHFPKAGDSGKILPKVRLLVVDLINPGRVHKHLNPPVELRGKEHYLTMVTWQDSTHVIVTWSNRPQNKSLICVCDVTNGACHTDLEESGSEGVGWVEIPTPRVIGGGQSYLMILPERDGNHGYWKHIALISTQYRSEAAKTFVTQGTWDVIKLVGYDEQKKLVYYISTDGDPRKRHLFRVALPKSDQLSPPECLTCDLGEDCQYVSASFSHSGKYYLLSCLGPGVPQYILRGTQNNLNILLEDNAALKERLEKKAVSKPEYHQINTDDGEKIWVKVYLPPTLNKKHIVIYPLLVNTYGAPDTQLVTFQFRLGWELYLTSMEKIIVVKVDGRGSGARGQRFLHRIYRNLGTFEVQDQITAVRYLQEKLSYVDHERCAIWGWSFGGFVSSHVMGDKSNVITCGIAVAPVTDWRYYDTAYTEKYMGLAVDNYRGYDNANASRKAANIRGKNLMVIHGTADDNVHFQHTAQFIKALTEADVDFRIHVYADKKHSISGGNTRKHLYRTITKYLQQQCWDGGEPRERGADTEES